MPVSVTNISGNIVAYGSWSGVHGNQFIVDWHNAGPHCTVIMLAGADYGGGINVFSSKVPYKEVELLVDTFRESEYDLYEAVYKLLEETK